MSKAQKILDKIVKVKPAKKSREFPFGRRQVTGIGTGRINPAWSKAWDRGQV